MAPIRVLHIINSLIRGGAERLLVNILQAHDRTQVHPMVITLYNRLDLAPQLREAGITVGTLGLSGTWRIPLAVGQLRTIIGSLQPDIVHTNLNAANISGRVAAWLSGRPKVVSGIHSLMYDPAIYLDNPDQKPWKVAALRQVDRWTSQRVNTTYVGCSHHVGESARAALKLPARQFRTIYNGIVVPALAPRPDRPTQTLELITVGRPIPEKGHKYLISAMPQILARHPNVRLRIVGGGPLENELRQQVAQLHLEQHVEVMGMRADIAELLNASDIFVFPSVSEGLPLAPLEALGCGLAIVASDIPALREIIDPDVQGLLVPAQDSQALANAVIILLDSPARRHTMGQAGYQRIRERFNIDTTARAFETMYVELMSTV
jgi:glycosyltransferase involved in cell wall biosynthesis